METSELVARALFYQMEVSFLFIYLFPNDAVEANRATLKEP
jgi:hypothetical protein